MRNYGIGRDYNAETNGLNGKMSEFHAIIGLENLSQLEHVMSARAKLAALLRKGIIEYTIFTVPDQYALGKTTHKDFPIFIPKGWEKKRSALIKYLREMGIETRTYFSPPLHQQERFRRYSHRRLAVTEDISSRILILPFFTKMEKRQADLLVDALSKAKAKLF